MKPILKPQYRTAVLYRDRLVYDIDFESWKIARMRVNDKTVQAETSTDEEADMFLERKFNTALSLIKGKLQFCLDYRTAAGDTADDKLKYQTDGDVELQPTEGDDEITAEPETEEGESTQQWPTHYTIGFRFSPYWYGNIETIKTCIHQYIVCYTLSEWFGLVKPDEAATYLQKAEDYKKEVINYCRQENAYGVTFRL